MLCSRLTPGACLALLALSTSVQAQPADGLPLPAAEVGKVVDLSGHWVIPSSRGQPRGSVRFTNTLCTRAGDVYSVAFTLPGGQTRTLEALFDGRTLTVRRPAAGGVAAGLAPLTLPAERTGATEVLARFGEEDRAREGSSAPAATSAGDPDPEAGPPPEEGRYRFQPATIGGARAGIFVAQGRVHPDGAMPVARFGRAEVQVKIVRADGVQAPLEVGVGERLSLRAEPSSPGEGRYEWSVSGASAQLTARGQEADLEGAAAGEVQVQVTYVPAAVGSQHTARATVAVKPHVARVDLTGLTFTSDHGLLKDNASDWTGSGSPLPEPEWTPTEQHPISHTMSQPVRVRLTLEVEPADALPEQVTLVGQGTGGIAFRQQVTLRGGRNEVALESAQGFERKIQRLDLGVRWSLEGTRAPLEHSSTTTTVYVTLDVPTDPARVQGITVKRMEKAIEAVGTANSLDAHQIARAVIQKWNHFNLQVAYYNAWELGDDRRDPTTGALVGADCQTIVRFTRNVIKMVGVPGEAQFVVIWAKVKTPTKGEESPNAVNHMTRPMQRYNDHNPRDEAKQEWIAALVDGGGGLNNYEAALRFSEGGQTKYYPGGVRAVMDRPDQIIGVFTTMSWVDITDLSSGPKAHIHRYR